MTIRGDRPATYRDVFAVREFRVLFAGFGILLIGETVQMLALSVLVYSVTGSPMFAAFAYVAGFLPHAIGGSFLLSIADRWPSRTVMVGYDLVRTGVAVVLAVGVLSPASMIALVFLAGVLSPVATASRTALLPELLAGDAYVLGRSAFTVAAGATQALGFGVGGILLAWTGPYGAIWLAAAASAVRAIVTRFGLPHRPARAGTRTSATSAREADADGATAGRPVADRTASRGGAVRQTWRVNRQLLADRRIRGLLLAQWLPGAMMVGAEGVIVPYMTDLGRPAGAGVLFMSAAIGMLIGDLVVARLVPPVWRERLTPWLAALNGLPLIGFLLRPGTPMAAILLAMATMGFAYHLGLARRFVEAVPESVRGQAFGVVTTGMMTIQGGAAAVAGGLAELVSAGTVMAIAGAASLTATLALLPHLASRSRRRPMPQAPREPREAVQG